MKVAIPNSEEVDGKFSEKIGIFHDENNDIVTFSGTSNVTFDNQNRNFESIDVFTSWDDLERVKVKVEDFEKLWTDTTKSVQVYDFEFAEKNNIDIILSSNQMLIGKSNLDVTNDLQKIISYIFIMTPLQ